MSDSWLDFLNYQCMGAHWKPLMETFSMSTTSDIFMRIRKMLSVGGPKVFTECYLDKHFVNERTW